jgi:two-component system response regulator AtoC
VRDLERQLIRMALERSGGSRPKAAELLGISHPALLYKAKEYGILGS